MGGNDIGIRTPVLCDRVDDGVFTGNGDWDGNCTTDGYSNSSRTVGIDGILQGSPSVDANNNNTGNGASVSGKQPEGGGLELIDKILECKENQEIYEDLGTLSVSFFSRWRTGGDAGVMRRGMANLVRDKGRTGICWYFDHFHSFPSHSGPSVQWTYPNIHCQ